MTTIQTVIFVSCTCPCCGQETALLVPTRGYRLWQEGELIQNALPTLFPSEREALISGLCETCQAEVFGGDDND